MLRSDEHHKILQMLERESPQFGRHAGGVECGAISAVAPASSFQPPASRILDWPDVPDLLSLAVEPISWLVERMIPRAAVTLVAGEPGSYKSWLALRLAKSVAEGAAFLERACPALPVLYLDRENPQAVVRERMEVLETRGSKQEAGTDWPEPRISSVRPPAPGLRIWGGWLGDAPPLIGDARLVQIARRWKPLLIFDSLIRFHEGDENSATEMAPVMGELRALAHAGATVVALHHRAKSETSRYRGSSDILGGVDVAFAVSRDRNAGLLKLQCFKSRFASEFAITLRPDLESSGDFAVADLPEVSREAADVEALRRLIVTEPGLSQRNLVKKAGLPEKRGIELLRREEGRAWRAERGAHGAVRYFPHTSMDWEDGCAEAAQLFSS